MPALAASAARAPSAQALLRLQPGLQPLRAARLARWSKGWPIGLPRGGPQPADRPAASAGSSGGGGDAQEGAEGSADLSSSRPSSGPDAPTTKQTLEALDQLLGVELKPVEQPAPPPPAAEKRPAAAQQPRRPGEPQLTFYDPNEEAGWKYKTRCVLVGVVGGTALLLTMVVPVALVWFLRHGVPLDRIGDVARLKPGDCLELQQRMVCRRELDDFSEQSSWRGL